MEHVSLQAWMDNLISVGNGVVNFNFNVIDGLSICELCQEDTLQEDRMLWSARDKHHEKNLTFGKFGFV